MEYWYTGFFNVGDKVVLNREITARTDALRFRNVKYIRVPSGTVLEITRKCDGGVGGGFFGGYEANIVGTTDCLTFVPELVLDYPK